MTASASSTLPPAIPEAERRSHVGRAGPLSVYVAGSGPPMLLLHSINAAGSAYEIRPVFRHFMDRFRVYAPDLPGFGFSDRSERRYDVGLFVDAVYDSLDIIAMDAGDAPVHAVALSLAAEFLARAAGQVPGRFRHLTLINPTGFDRRAERLRVPGANREVPGMSRLLERAPWGPAAYRLLTVPASIRYFLRRTYGQREVDEDMVTYDCLTCRQPGAHHAPLAFISGRLFSKDARLLYGALKGPVWLPHGTRGDFADFSGADWARATPGWNVEAFPTGALPHFERPDLFFASADRELVP